MKGVIDKFNGEKGFGFIKSSEARCDVFFHKSAVSDEVEMKRGTHVEFELIDSQRGPKAVHINVEEGKWHTEDKTK